MQRAIAEGVSHTASIQRVLRWLTALGLSAALGILALGCAILLDARKDAWRQAEQASSNLVQALVQDIARHIAVYDLSIQGVSKGLALPGINQVSPEIRQMALFDQAASADYLGALVALNSAGDIVADSTSIVPHSYNLGDRDYFRIHAERVDAGLFISRPIRSRLRGDMMIVMSRRLSGPDGRFGGIVMGSMRLAYFQDLFAQLDLGSKGSITLFRTDGRLIMRRPLHEVDIDRNLNDTETFRQYNATTSGHVVGTAAVDGVERLYTYQHIGNLPLILGLGVAVEEIYAAWWHKAVGIASALAALCTTTVALCLLARKEIMRRTAAEQALLKAAERLSILATTDGLTGLANRRAFEEALTQEWRRAIRGKTSVALLMLDADCFKLFNDHYGHMEGDYVLKSIATRIEQNVLRPPDTGARYGGEEFVVLLPETELVGALVVAERVRAAVADLDIPHLGSPSGNVTVSIGVATARPTLKDVEASLIKRADAALYEAKRAGRNRVYAADGIEWPIMTASLSPTAAHPPPSSS